MLLLPPAQPNATQGEIVEFRAKGIMFHRDQSNDSKAYNCPQIFMSRVSNIASDNSQNVGLEDYNNISVGIFPYFTTPSIKITLG